MEDRRTPLQYRLEAPMIHLSGIYKSYQTPAGAIPALLGIDLKVFPGEFLVLIGKSGAGKSTLVNVLTGIDLPDHGEILVDGAAVHLMDEDQRARWRGRTMGVVFQFFQLMPSISLLRNITMPMEFCGFLTPAERKHRSLELLEQVGIGDHANKKPAHISGGQQQRAAIARALANDPPIIIADEPTGNLDSKTAKEILDLFKSLIDQGKTILIVTHDKSVAKYASRIIEIKDGMIN